jgi:hypothetical protein
VAAKAPGLGDQYDGGLHALERRIELAEHLRADELGEIEAEAVYVVGFDEVA